MANALLRSSLLGAGLTAALLGGCSGSDRRELPAAEIYAAAIQWLVEDGDPAPSGPTVRVFVEAVGEDVIPLPVQAGVVNTLEDALTIRFIDSRNEAILTAVPGDPVRDGGVLVGLGPLSDVERPPVRLYGDRYLDVREVAAYELLVEQVGGRWQVIGDPEPVPLQERDPDRRS